MKSFEEQFSAWVDGELPEAERRAFEDELKERPDAAENREAALKLGNLLRQQSPVPELPNADFFNQRIMEEIAPPADATPATPRERTLFPLWRLAWIGAFCLLAAFAIFQFAVPKGPYENSAEDLYLAEIIEANPGDPGISATAFHSEKSNVTVLWLDGLEYIPDTYALK